MVKTFVGDGSRTGGGDADNAYRIIVDFAGGPLDELKSDAAVVSDVSAGGVATTLKSSNTMLNSSRQTKTGVCPCWSGPAAGKIRFSWPVAA